MAFGKRKQNKLWCALLMIFGMISGPTAAGTERAVPAYH
jgi:hypothetical protein